MWLIVGLGNPGSEYASTRHNIGAIAVERWAAEVGGLSRNKKMQALTATARVGSEQLLLAFPQTFMNKSGASVSALMNFYKIDASQLVVLHDELDLPFATMRLKLGGGDNGHNGLRSIRAAIGTGDFHRVRLGIDRPPGQMDPAAYVLRAFTKSEAGDIDDLCDRAAAATQLLITDGLAAAQGRFNQ